MAYCGYLPVLQMYPQPHVNTIAPRKNQSPTHLIGHTMCDTRATDTSPQVVCLANTVATTTLPKFSPTPGLTPPPTTVIGGGGLVDFGGTPTVTTGVITFGAGSGTPFLLLPPWRASAAPPQANTTPLPLPLVLAYSLANFNAAANLAFPQLSIDPGVIPPGATITATLYVNGVATPVTASVSSTTAPTFGVITAPGTGTISIAPGSILNVVATATASVTLAVPVPETTITGTTISFTLRERSAA